MSTYNISISRRAQKDIDNLSISNHDRIVINRDISNLQYMPRAHKTLYFVVDPEGEYRRILSGKYIIIYKIDKYDIIVVRVFSQKQDYLNSHNFILKESSEKYKKQNRKNKSV